MKWKYKQTYVEIGWDCVMFSTWIGERYFSIEYIHARDF